MKKGFTLIELLAVIVILAIIALIATPIILGIINDARKESYERSIDLYASAVRNAITSYQLTHPTTPTKFSDLDIQYDGEVECVKEELYADGSFYIAECTVNGTEIDYTYGKKQITQVYKPQYYYFGFDWNGTVGETAAPSNPSTVAPEGKNFYLGYDVEDGKVSAAYSCFVRNETEYCLKGTTDGSAFDTNNTVLEEAFKDVENACGFEDNSFCSADGLEEVFAESIGNVGVDDSGVCCTVGSDGSFECFEW